MTTEVLVTETKVPAAQVEDEAARLMQEKKEKRTATEILLEQDFEAGTAAVARIGAGLKTIRESRLYLGDYESWGEYCLKRWGMSKSYADHIIAGAKLAAEKLTPAGVAFNNEGQLRALVKLNDKQFERALAKAREVAKEKSLPLTASLVAEQLPKHRKKAQALRLPTTVSSALEMLVPQVEAVINGKDSTRSLDVLQKVREFLNELKKSAKSATK